MRPDSYLAKGLNVSSRILLGTAYIYVEDRLEFMTLNETGTFVWDQINGTRQVKEILRNSRDAFDAPPEAVDQAILEFLSFLWNEQLIMMSDTAFEGVMADV